jgi:hypothetical protein
MSFFSKVKEIMRMVFGTTFTEEETRSHNRLCNKFINKIKLGVTDLKEIKQDLVEISEKGASKMVKVKINKLIRQMKVKNSDAYKIKDEKDYKKFLNRELKRVYDLSSDEVKRVKNIIKGKKSFVPEIEEDIQFVVFPIWWDMDKEVYRALAKELTLDKILDDLEGVEYGKVSMKDEAKWYSAKNVEKLNKYYDRHPKRGNVCNQSISEVLTYKGPSKDICDGCIEYKANLKLRDMLESSEVVNQSINKYNQRVEDRPSQDIVQEKENNVSSSATKSKDDLFEIKDKNVGKRPRLKKTGFEFPHIIYCSTPEGIYQPQVFYPLQLARVNFHKRHPRFRKNYEQEVQLSADEIEPEKAYRKLLRKRYKEEVEMIECFLKDEEHFKNDIPKETCTMVLNVNCEENRKLYENCVAYMKKKSEILNKYNLTGDLNMKLKREINLDEDLSAQKLDPMEVYNELKILSEEAKCMNEEDFPDDWYTDERESDIEEGEGRVYSSKIEDRFTNPKYVVDNKMLEVVDHAEERSHQLRLESIAQNKNEKDNESISVDDKCIIDEDTATTKKYKNDSTDEISFATNDAVVTVNKVKKSEGFKARKPVPKIKLDAEEQIIKRHDELIKKRADDDAEMERVGQKAHKMVMEKLYGINASDKSNEQDNREDSELTISKRKASFFEQLSQDHEKKKFEKANQENNGLFNVKDPTRSIESNKPDVSPLEQNIRNDLSFPSKPLIGATDNKESRKVSMGSSFNINKSETSSIPSFMGQSNGANINFSSPVFGQQNNDMMDTFDNSGKDVNTPQFTDQNTSIPGVKIPGVSGNSGFDQNSFTSNEIKSSSFFGQSNSMMDTTNNQETINSSFTGQSFNQFSGASSPIPFSYKNNPAEPISEDQNSKTTFNSLHNAKNWIPSRQPDEWRPAPRFGGTICSPLDLPMGPPVKIDPAQHGPWGHIDLPDREPPKDEDWSYSNRPIKRERNPTKSPLGGIPPISNTNQSNSPFSCGTNSPLISFQPPNGQNQSYSPFTSTSTGNNSSFENNIMPAPNIKQVSSQDIFNTDRGGGMFDSLIENSNNQKEDDAPPSVQYRNMNDEENSGFNFYFK